MIFSELYKTMVNKAAFMGFRWGDRPPPLDPPLVEAGLKFFMIFSEVCRWGSFEQPYALLYEHWQSHMKQQTIILWQ